MSIIEACFINSMLQKWLGKHRAQAIVTDTLLTKWCVTDSFNIGLVMSQILPTALACCQTNP